MRSLLICLFISNLLSHSAYGLMRMPEGKTKVFSSGNLYFKLYPNSIQREVLIKGKDIYFEVSHEQSPALFLESLFKIYAAKKAGANIVTVPPSKFSSFQNLLLKTAGAELTPGSLTPSITGTHMTPEQKLIISGETHPQLAHSISRELGVPFKTKAALADQDLHQTHVLLVSPPDGSVGSLYTTLEEILTLKIKGARVTLITPYLPYARNDKPEPQYGVTAQGRLVADLIEAVGTDAICFSRAHAAQSAGFFNIPTHEVSGRKTINHYLKGQGVEIVISPDAGFQKDATLYGDELKVPTVIFNKQRDSDGKATMKGKLLYPELLNKTVAIIDDETASGSTGAKAAKIARDSGATKVLFVVSHLAGDAQQALDSEFIHEMTALNTLIYSGEKVRILDFTKELVEDLKLFLLP